MKIKNTEQKISEPWKWDENLDNFEIVLEQGQKLQQVLVFNRTIKAKIDYKLVESGAELELLIIVIGNDKCLINLSTLIAHLAPDTKARVALKAVLFEQSQLDFRGNIVVNKDASATDTYLKSESLLMSTEARAKAIPSLEIVANEVKAGHAATFGRVDDDSLFYLESRGFSRSQAKRLLLEAFLNEGKNFFTGLEQSQRDSVAEKIVTLLPENYKDE